MSSFNLDEFIRERDEALASLDADKIVAYVKKYDVKFPSKYDPIFWIAVHKAITANRNLPLSLRTVSKEYLAKHNMKPLDDSL